MIIIAIFLGALPLQLSATKGNWSQHVQLEAALRLVCLSQQKKMYDFVFSPPSPT